ncbi:major facilitator superfamily domain-containing protein [Hysterangium stoloniferum]|nr:major facilitator superfamily domain-containing protein [Hysterangium stoloniferum]
MDISSGSDVATKSHIRPLSSSSCVGAKGDPGTYIYVDWDGPNDPEKPVNLSKMRKWSLTILGTLNISNFEAAFGVVIFTLSFGIAPLALAPLSELFGRLPVYVASAIIFWIMFIPQALAQNLTTVLVSRFVSGIGASTSIAIVGGILADIWEMNERGLPMAIFSLAAFGGSGLGPSCFGYVELSLGFRYVNWILFGASGLLAFTIIIVSKETRAGASSVPLLFTELYDFNTGESGLIFMGQVIGPVFGLSSYQLNLLISGAKLTGDFFFFTLVINIWCDRAYHRNVSRKGPEARLYIAMVAGVILPVAWTGSKATFWLVPAIGICVIYTAYVLRFGSGHIFIGCLNECSVACFNYVYSLAYRYQADQLTTCVKWPVRCPFYMWGDVRPCGATHVLKNEHPFSGYNSRHTDGLRTREYYHGFMYEQDSISFMLFSQNDKLLLTKVELCMAICLRGIS